MKSLLRSSVQPSSLSLSLAACAALLGVACEGAEPRDLGSSTAPYTLVAPFESDIREFAGRWVGSAEDVLDAHGNGSVYQFPSGSSQIVLDVAEVGTENGGLPLEGSIRFGSGDPLPPPTDPDSGYPVGLSYDAYLAYSDGLVFPFVKDLALPPFEGTDYPVAPRGELILNEEGSWSASDGVVRFAFSVNQPLDAWCKLQTPHAYPGYTYGYSCLPNTGGQYESGSPGSDALCALWGPPDFESCADPSNPDDCIDIGEPVAYANCDKVFLCESNDYCTCSEAGCNATDSGSSLTVRRVGDELVGMFQETVFFNERHLRVPLGEVRLQRVSAE